MIKRQAPLLAVATAAAAVVGAGIYFYGGGHNAPAHQPPLADLTGQSIAAFQAEFNRAADQVRLVLLLSPT